MSASEAKKNDQGNVVRNVKSQRQQDIWLQQQFRLFNYDQNKDKHFDERSRPH